MRLLDPLLKVERQADPVHLGQAQFRQCYKAQFSERMISTAKTREQRQSHQKVLSKDIKAICSIVIKHLLKLHAGDMTTLKQLLPRVLEATVNCYAGNC